jgi:cellulose biosynthesis protein BcsQ
MFNNNNHTRLAERSENMLQELTAQIKSAKSELQAHHYFQTYSKAALSKLPLLSKAIVDKTVNEMEAEGYQFQKISAGSAQKYAMTINNIIDIYHYRQIPKYRDRYQDAFTVFIGNLKGGVSKTVSTVSLAHGLRTHPHLLQADLRILVIDLDPQSSATMFLSHEHSIGCVEETAAQAMLQNVSRQTLLDEFIVESGIPGVDVMPASIDDAFIASKWDDLCAEHLPGQAIYSVLKDNVINKINDDYDFIFIDSGPHLDAYLMNALAAADLLLTPIPPAQVDFHSTLKYLTRLPELLSLSRQSGTDDNIIGHIGFMSKLANKSDHKICHSLAKEIFGGDMLDAHLPRRDGFERSGETYDTVFSINPLNYVGSSEALKEARTSAYVFSKSFYDRIEFMRAN